MMHMRYPNGGIKAGTIVNDAVVNVDLVPTIFDFIGIEGDYDTDGLSIRSLVDGSSAGVDRDEIVMEFANDYAAVEVGIVPWIGDKDNTFASGFLPWECAIVCRHCFMFLFYFLFFIVHVGPWCNEVCGAGSGEGQQLCLERRRELVPGVGRRVPTVRLGA